MAVVALWTLDVLQGELSPEVWEAHGGRLRQWIDSGEKGIAVYRNEDLGSPDLGDIVCLSYGCSAAQLEVKEASQLPARCPDLYRPMWAYQLTAVVLKKGDETLPAGAGETEDRLLLGYRDLPAALTVEEFRKRVEAMSTPDAQTYGDGLCQKVESWATEADGVAFYVTGRGPSTPRRVLMCSYGPEAPVDPPPPYHMLLGEGEPLPDVWGEFTLRFRVTNGSGAEGT